MVAHPESEPILFCVSFVPNPEFEETDSDLCFLASVDQSKQVPVCGQLHFRGKLYNIK